MKNNVVTFDDIKIYEVSEGMEVWACRGLTKVEFMRWYLKEMFDDEKYDDYTISDFEELSIETVFNNEIRVDEDTYEKRKAGDIFKERLFNGESLPMMLWTKEW